MQVSRRVCRGLVVLSAALLVLGGSIRFSRAEAPGASDPARSAPVPAFFPAFADILPPSPVAEPLAAPKEVPVKAAADAPPPRKESDEPADKPGAPAKTDKEPSKPAAAQNGGSRPSSRFDPATVRAGQEAFESSCTSCHTAARSLERTKDLAGWRATVRRMAAKRGAEIASGDIEPIAVYLASRSAPASEQSAAEGGKAAAPAGGGETAAEKDKAAAAAAANETSSLSTFATLSPLWRGGNDNLQNPGFAPLAWVGASWQGQVLSGRITACTACHGVQEPAFLSRIEVVEAAVRVDLSKYVEPCWHGLKASIDAGRIIIPFGAFSSQTNPGVYRTVSTPLIFNMGQRIYNQDLGVPVLPMPFADEGVNFSLDIPVAKPCTGPITASVDAYLNNGLWGSSSGIDWLQSRNYLDNNDRPAYGGRVSVGDQYLRAGASIMGGRFDDPRDLSVVNGPLEYRIYGFDIQARYKRLFRFQIEYARRDSDRLGLPDDPARIFGERVDGYYMEAEVRPWDECRVSLLARHDFLRTNSPLPPPGSTLPTGVFNVERLTLGVNIELWHQSLLMIDYERWFIPEQPNVANVFGVRYTVTF